MTMHGDKPFFSQSQEGATLEPYDPTLREKTEAVIRNLLTEYGGLSRGGARNIAQGFTGTTDPSQGIAESLGVLDFTPAGLLFGGQEAKRDFDKAQSGLDYIAPTVGLALTGLEAFPLTKVMTKPARTFLSNLSRKSPEIDEPVITSASDKPKDPSRRKFIQGAASVPVAAGALSNIPVTKIIDDIAPVAKKVGKVLPKDFSLASTKFFKKAIKNIKSETRDSYRDTPEIGQMIINEMDESNPQELLDSAFSTGFFDAEDAIRDIKKKYPGATDDEIYNLFPESAEVSRELVEMISPDFTFVEFPKFGFNKEEKMGEIIKTKGEAVEKLNSLREQYPDVEFISFYETSEMFPDLDGHKIYYKKSNDDLVTPENRKKKFNDEPADMTLRDVGIPSEEAPN